MKPKKILDTYIYIYILDQFQFSNSIHNFHLDFLDELRNGQLRSTTTFLLFKITFRNEWTRAARGVAPSTASIRYGQRRVGSRVFGEAHARHLSTRFFINEYSLSFASSFARAYALLLGSGKNRRDGERGREEERKKEVW